MMVVVVDKRKELIIKGVSIQQPYNHGLSAVVSNTLHVSCTSVVMLTKYKTGNYSILQLQQNT